jgi:UPF0271 protein
VPTADDDAMFALISSASVACGGHAGDTASMRSAVERAARTGVAIGAHPPTPTARASDGRRCRSRRPTSARASTPSSRARGAGADIRYVKPHGALYHAVRGDVGHARAVVDAVASVSAALGRAVPILGLDGVIADEASRTGLPFVREAFLDRGYLPDGGLVPRSDPRALLRDPEAVAARAVRLARSGVVEAIDGSLVEAAAASLCVHGDSPGALAMARAVRAALDAAGVDIAAPW